MTEVCAQCHHDDSAPYIRFCAACRVAEKRIIDRAEAGDWFGSERVRIAIMRLHNGSGFYLRGLFELAARTGWAPSVSQGRRCCVGLVADPRHRPTWSCSSTPWPVQLAHEVLLTRGGQFALLSQVFVVEPSDRPWVIDVPAPYGHGTTALLVTPGRLANPGAQPARRVVETARRRP